MDQLREVKVVFSGAPSGGFQTYPAGFGIASATDTGSSQYKEILALHKLDDGRIAYNFVMYNFKTTKGGRPGSNFGMWLIMHNQYIGNENSNELLQFFREAFENLFVKHGIIGQDHSEYYFNIQNFEDKEETLSKIAKVIEKNFLESFRTALRYGTPGMDDKIMYAEVFDNQLQPVPYPSPTRAPRQEPYYNLELSNPTVPEPQPQQPSPEENKWKRKAKQREIIALVASLLLFAVLLWVILEPPSPILTPPNEENEATSNDTTVRENQQSENQETGKSDSSKSNAPQENKTKPKNEPTKTSKGISKESRDEQEDTTTNHTTEPSPASQGPPRIAPTPQIAVIPSFDLSEQSVSSEEENQTPKIWDGDGKFVRRETHPSGKIQYYLNRDAFCEDIKSVQNYQDFLNKLAKKLDGIDFYTKLNISNTGKWMNNFKQNNKNDLTGIKDMIDKAKKDNPNHSEIWINAESKRNKKISNKLLLHQI